MTEASKPTLTRFGKPSAAWFDMKSFFYDRDKELAEHALRIAEIYAQQPVRTSCKICSAQIACEPVFKKHNIGYVICRECGHFNGLHEDTDDFNRAVYVEDSSVIYQLAYSSEDREKYNKRVDEVYRPKANFLAEALHSDGHDPLGMTVDDFGAGSGYFVAALLKEGFNASGHDVSAEQVAFGTQMIGEGALRQVAMEDALDLVRSTDAKVLSFIFVLEHLQDPISLLEAAASNPAVEYVYFSVPMLSASVFFETAFPQYYHRHLSAGHTHLFTDSSLRWIENTLSFRRVGEWWFGLDMVDLVRILGVHFSANEATAGATALWNEMMMPVLDALQVEFDRRRQASEVHMLWKVKA